jgi:hypothetical protein
LPPLRRSGAAHRLRVERGDFPRSLEELELRKASARAVVEDRADAVVVPKRLAKKRAAAKKP